MADLPTEIITKILLLLPIKDILSCRGVCKSWSSVIKTPDFIKLHLNQTLISTSDRYLLLCGGASLYFAAIDLDFRRSNHNLSFSELRVPFQLTQVNFIGSCNGVICISNYSDDIFLYNPLTRSHFHVPNIPFPKQDDDDDDFVSFGFGYDSTTDDYKILRIVQRFVNGRFCHDEAMLFSLKNCSWKSIQGIGSSISRPFPSYYYGSSDRCRFGCLVNEVLHYIVDKEIADKENVDEKYRLKIRSSIACFNLKTETFSFMNFCRSDDYSYIYNYTDELELRELGGCLSVIKMLYDDMGDYDELWVMRDYGDKESSVYLDANYRNAMLPIIYLKDEGKFVCQNHTKWFHWYDLESRNFKRFTIHKLPNEPFTTGVFVGSLASFPDELHPETDNKTLPMDREEK